MTKGDKMKEFEELESCPICEDIRRLSKPNNKHTGIQCLYHHLPQSIVKSEDKPTKSDWQGFNGK